MDADSILSGFSGSFLHWAAVNGALKPTPSC